MRKMVLVALLTLTTCVVGLRSLPYDTAAGDEAARPPSEVASAAESSAASDAASAAAPFASQPAASAPLEADGVAVKN